MASGLKTFRFAGRAKDGNILKGNVTAWDQEQALNQLRMRGVAVTDLQVLLDTPLKTVARDMVGGENLSIIYRQLATLVNAGVSVQVSFELLARQDNTDAERRVLEGVSNAMTVGMSLSQAMSLYPGAFGPPHVAMVRAAEYGGILPAVLEVLATFTEQATRLQRKVKSSTTYPMFVFLASLATIIGLFRFIMPQFVSLVQDLQVKLPWSTHLLMGVAAIIGHPLFIIVFILLLVFSPKIFRALSHRAEVKNLLDTHSLKAAVVGQVTHKVALARSLQMLSALSHAGVPLRDSLPLSGAVSGNNVVRRAFEDLVPPLDGGMSLADAMKDNREIFPRTLIAYVEVGEQAGALPDMLVHASKVMTIDAHNALDVLPELIEPLVIIVLGLMVGYILISVFVPLYAALKVV
ncbi:MAG: type II secretion system F family protein [Armatimonadetes bacterium]|nr:type II secretion system F family protein [Armatimonadota bacterium]